MNDISFHHCQDGFLNVVPIEYFNDLVIYDVSKLVLEDVDSFVTIMSPFKYVMKLAGNFVFTKHVAPSSVMLLSHPIDAVGVLLLLESHDVLVTKIFKSLST